ncbi:MAG: hypothetical protein ACXWNC_00635 [Anaerolineales bacterium]
MKNSKLIIILVYICTACSNTPRIHSTDSPATTPIPVTTTLPTQTNIPVINSTSSQSPTATLSSAAWKSMPVIPEGVSSHIIDTFNQGLALGRDPTRFSKIGDCQNIIPYFLSAFDDPSKYHLGSQYAYLQQTIEHFQGSWSRPSLATHGGYNAATVLSSFWTLVPRPGVCEKGETPVACEIRVYNPSFAIISMEEAWSGDLQKYDHYLRMLVEYVLSQNVVPIIATRAEIPGSQISINETVAQIAYDYKIPLWNFGSATLVLPNYGLIPDGFHLTPGTVEGNYNFDDPVRMELGWTWRNLTALQTIDSVYQFIISHN